MDIIFSLFSLTLTNFYGYTSAEDDKALLEALNTNIDSISKRFSNMKIILGGDFNSTINYVD